MTHQIINADCLDQLPKFAPEEEFDFIFADPPFNIGQRYEGYRDALNNVDYKCWTLAWLDRCWNRCRGVMAIHGSCQVAELYEYWARSRGHQRVADLAWHYRFGQCSRANWINAHCRCLVFAKHDDYTWNPESVLVDSDRKSTYEDKRIHETENGGQRLPGTVWGIPSDGPYWGRVQGNNTERRKGHPNQLPEVYLERLILAYTNPGDSILDPFGGSGTTLVVADALGRKCTTIDISKANCDSMRRRLKKGAVRIEKEVVR